MNVLIVVVGVLLLLFTCLHAIRRDYESKVSSDYVIVGAVLLACGIKGILFVIYVILYY